jgi:GntR family transcriptional regulator, transcriptional repressor for pyruvate dehydrogenase complex
MFEAIKNTKVFDQVIGQIKELIRQGDLKCGDKLPSERDMCEQLRVSRTSIREALRALEMLGIIEARQGGGNYIKEQFEDSFFEPLSLTFLLHGSNIDEVIKFRQMMEPQAAGEAAVRRSEEQLEEMKRLLCELKTTENETVSAAIDKQLHYKIIEASGNKLVAYTMYAVSALVEEYIINTRSSMIKNPENKSLLYEQHDNIIHAIEKQDSAEAIRAMSEHLIYSMRYE